MSKKCGKSDFGFQPEAEASTNVCWTLRRCFTHKVPAMGVNDNTCMNSVLDQ